MDMIATAAKLDDLWKRGRDFLGTDYAILAGAMTWVSERNLVSALSNAGGFGVVACGAMTPELLDTEIAATKAAGGRIIPVGTTALRLIETAARAGSIKPWEGATDIFIYPGFTFQVCDGLMTNFHLPRSTLMMLVSALMGPSRIKEIYAHAIANDYRFFSYGDSSLLLP